MPVAKIKASNSTDLMKAEEPNDSLDTLIRQAIGKEPFYSFSRPGDSPVQWIQLLHALDQPDLPGWPLLTPIKVQMQKCDKCSWEFCSSINLRRHTRVHHRCKDLDKDSAKNRDLLAAFWDKLSEDEEKEILSFEDVPLEEVAGSAVVEALTALTRKPGYSCLPQVCLRAGSLLLDIIQSRPSRFPISSQELFAVLDDASEKTFLSGPALTMQKYIFDGEVGKIGLETKNVVACASFLVEHKLIKAWHAEQDAEALRYQNLLMEEEEAAHRRQAEILEKKRQKKLRQQRAKELRQADVKEDVSDALEDAPLDEMSISSPSSDSYALNIDDALTSSETLQLSNTVNDVDFKMAVASTIVDSELSTGQIVEHRGINGSNRRHSLVARRVPHKERRMVNGFYGSQNPQGPKLGATQKHGNNRDSRTVTVTTGTKIWSRKPKVENNGENFKNRMHQEIIKPSNKNNQVLIGSIAVTLGASNQRDGPNPADAQENCLEEHHAPKKNTFQDKPNKLDSVQSGTNRATVKLWRPVSRNGTKGSMTVENNKREHEVAVTVENDGDQIVPSQSCLRSGDEAIFAESASLQFDRQTAEAFLGLRWKEAMAAEHVQLDLTDSEPSGCMDDQNDGQVPGDGHARNILGNSGNWMVDKGGFESPTTTGLPKAKFRSKPEKGAKQRYQFYQWSSVENFRVKILPFLISQDFVFLGNFSLFHFFSF
ncbi:hypothetical protein ACFE04_028636 [Oxalis oulophora]